MGLSKRKCLGVVSSLSGASEREVEDLALVGEWTGGENSFEELIGNVSKSIERLFWIKWVI